MKKVILISYDFPPRKGVGGNRIYGLAKYLSFFGFEPIVLTAKLPYQHSANFRVIESGYKDKLFQIKKILGLNIDISIYEESALLKSLAIDRNIILTKMINLLKWILFFPDRYSSWYKNAIKDIDNLIEEEDIYGIISSLNPIISHRIGKYIKKKTNACWIADYRDLWSNNHYIDVFNIQRRLMYCYEKRIISNADYLVTVSDPLAKNLYEIHKKPVEVITTGFDYYDDNYTNLSRCFNIVYTGQLLKGKRDPSPLFKAVSEIIKEKIIKDFSVSIMFYGPESSWLNELIEKYELSNYILYKGLVEKSLSIQMQREAQILLQLNMDNETDVGNYTGKIFEYIAAKRPIISIGREDSVVSNLIKNSNIGIATNEYEKIKNYIINAFKEFKNTGYVKYRGNANYLEQYTFKNMTHKFINLLIQNKK